MIKNKNYDFCVEGLSLMTGVLRSLVFNALKETYGDEWFEKGVRAKFNTAPDEYIPQGKTAEEAMEKGDFSFFANLIIRSLKDPTFRSLDYEQTLNIREIKDKRNKLAHLSDIQKITTDFAERLLDTMYQFLKKLPEFSSQTKQIQAMERELSQSNEAVNSADQEQTEASASSFGDAIPSWRSIVSPRPEIANGDFGSSTFALNLSNVLDSSHRFQEFASPLEFFDRTYLTFGIKGLLKKVAQRLAGTSQDSVIEVKTTFGGGKTHSMLAAYYMVKNASRIDDLKGVRSILNEAEVKSLPSKVSTAILVGTDISTSTPRKVEGTFLKTMWGVMAYQLWKSSGNEKAFDAIRKSDKDMTSPSTSEFKEMLNASGPSLIIIDELVAYARKLDGKTNSIGGDFESFLTGVQALTEAVSSTDKCVLLCSIPESNAELGGERGKSVAESLSKVFSRMERPWQVATEEESFNIVRRRIFSDRTPEQQTQIESICKKYIDMYANFTQLFGNQYNNAEYLKRMVDCYPFHPSLFDDLYGKWGCLENFQRTRSVLNLLSNVVNKEWQSGDQSALITPGNMPLEEVKVRDVLLDVLKNESWNSVLDAEITGRDSTAKTLDKKIPNYGQFNACMKVSKALFMGSVPTGTGISRGLELPEVLVAVSSPSDSTPSIYRDALLKIKDTSSHINNIGNFYFFDTAPSVNKLIKQEEELIKEEDILNEIRSTISAKFSIGHYFISAIWPFDSQDVPDDEILRVAILPLKYAYSAKQYEDQCLENAKKILINHGDLKRSFRNRLVFLAPDYAIKDSLISHVRRLLALQNLQLNDELSKTMTKDLKTRVKDERNNVESEICECYRCLIIPKAKDEKDLDAIDFSEYDITGGFDAIKAIETLMLNQEYLIAKWNSSSLANELRKYYFKDSSNYIRIKDLYDDHCKYLYLPRLVNSAVLTGVVDSSLAAKESKFGYSDSLNEDKVPVDPKIYDYVSNFNASNENGFLLESSYALDLVRKERLSAPGATSCLSNPSIGENAPIVTSFSKGEGGGAAAQKDQGKNTSFFLTATIERDGSEVNKFNQIMNDIVYNLSPKAKISITVSDNNPDGYDPDTEKLVKENCESLDVGEYQFNKK